MLNLAKQLQDYVTSEHFKELPSWKQVLYLEGYLSIAYDKGKQEWWKEQDANQREST